MSSTLGKIASITAGALVTAAALENGYRYGRMAGEDRMVRFDTNMVLNASNSWGSDNFISNALAGPIKNNFFSNPLLTTISRTIGGITGAIGNLFGNILPLGLAVLGGVAAWSKNPATNKLTWIPLGLLGILGSASVLNAAGLTSHNNFNVNI